MALPDTSRKGAKTPRKLRIIFAPSRLCVKSTPLPPIHLHFNIRVNAELHRAGVTGIF